MRESFCLEDDRMPPIVKILTVEDVGNERLIGMIRWVQEQGIRSIDLNFISTSDRHGIRLHPTAWLAIKEIGACFERTEKQGNRKKENDD